MAAMIQTYPQQTGSVTLLQTRTGTAPGGMAGSSQAISSQAYGNPSRNGYTGLSNGNQMSYRTAGSAPIQPYAFTSTPSLATGSQPLQHVGYRTSSGTTVPTLQQMQVPVARPQLNGNSNQPTFAQVAAAKASPERYRRPTPRQTDSSPVAIPSPPMQASAVPVGSNTATVVHLYNPRALPPNQPVLNRPHSAYGTMDDMALHRQTDEEAKRFRRRSIHSINSPDYFDPVNSQAGKQTSDSTGADTGSKQKYPVGDAQKPSGRIVPVPSQSKKTEKSAVHTRNGSAESNGSSRSSNSRPSSANRNTSGSPLTGSPASTSSLSGDKTSTNDKVKIVNIPPRGSSTDVGKRAHSPSPLSNPVTMAAGPSPRDGAGAATSTTPPTSSHGPKVDSPAAKHLAAINEKGGKSKSKTSRLRRAFSFGSAAELRKATGQDIGADGSTNPQDGHARLHKEQRVEDAYEEEQARIAQKQEEGGIGSSIYSGTKLFAGSTDNLSISSTASSASIMLRKMGRGMKKSSRSLVGLFRPKSIIGSPTEELAAPEASQAAVSMVTVEAERDRVNVTTNAELSQSSGTGFPHLERNSMDATKTSDAVNSERLNSTSTENSATRKSIVGGEKERAEVLATIRKGILKTRSNSPTPTTPAAETKVPAFDLPLIPNVSDSPNSSAPSTPNDEVQGHRRNGSVALGNEDYFMSALRLRQDTKSAPATPQASHKRNATFSPRIVFHDTWPRGEYDRRGEIATCNLLTPMLAQQIKEELNSFKMVC
ncbi:hypothetical protein GGR57DRAFT_348206 [Xylariaceae sp. FL1272]|nr:hypothetical protein GGR57DRAFT_348206 [Xylariaceae sp. FL1272]